MHPYLPYLLKDIAAAHRKDETSYRNKDAMPKTFEEEMEEMEEMEEIERIVLEEPAHTLGYYFGLKKEDFPPAEQFSEKELEKICKAYQDMLWSWNISLDVPGTLPAAFLYNLKIVTLDRKIHILNSGISEINYCTGYAKECKLKEYCPCLEIWNEEENKLKL